ncbi:MAG: hypothetical protein ACFFDP_06570 [Promethearchaeota archaeon]
MAETGLQKSWRRIIIEALVLGIAGLFLLTALSYVIAAGVGTLGPTTGYIYLIWSFGFIGFFTLGLAIDLIQGNQ